MGKNRKKPKRPGETSQKGLSSSQNPCLEPKHKVFLSHSGAQKNFTAQLCEDLIGVNHFPFFDKRLDSLPKGEEFPPLIFKAARQCRVAILVLSEEFFTRSKWPMIELNEFVQAQAADNPGLKLLPLYFGLTLKQLKDPGNHKRWRATWERWAEDGRIDVGKWVQALSKVLGPVNGMEYDGVDEVAFRKSVVEAVCKLIPPDVEYDVSHIQARGRFCKAIQQKLDEEVEPYGVSRHRVIGLFGVPGMGKSTISKAMCNESLGEFFGKVCHVEFHGNNHVELRKKVLQEMTGLKQEHLPDEGDKLLYLLKSRMQRQKVFLIFDNVLSQEDIDEAKMYLDIGYLDSSRLLVTSRSLDVLKSVGIRDSDCMEMPELEEQDATNAFLHYARCNRVSFNQTELDIIKRCVEACKFKRSELGGSECGSNELKYLPLALKVWGTQLGDIANDPSSWVEDLRSLDEHKFNSLNEPEHPLFRVLRQGYDKLDQTDRHIFLDMAIFCPRQNVSDVTDFSIVEWLIIIYGCSKSSINRSGQFVRAVLYKCSKSSINRSLRAIRRKGLLEYSVKDFLAFKIHDLYVEFARVEAQVGAFDVRRILCEVNGADILWRMLERPASGIWPSLERLGLYKSQVKSLRSEALDCFPNVKILQLYDCHELVEVDVGGMERLMSLDVVGCEKLLEKFWGVWMLENLVWFRLGDIDEQLAPFSLDFSGLTSIQVLYLSCVLWKHKSIEPPDLSGCSKLRELTMSGFHSLESLPDLSKLFKLEKVYFRYCRDAKSVSGLSSLTELKVLSMYWCPEIAGLPGLGGLIALEALKLIDVGLSEIHGLAKLRHLRILIVSDCRYLSSLGGLEYVISLRVLDASGCKELREVPNTSNLRELEVVDLSHSGVCTLPSDFERLAEHGILKIEGCVGLFEPLVVWLLDQERHQSGGCVESMVEQDVHQSRGKFLETRSKSPTQVMPTLVTPTSAVALPKKCMCSATSGKLFVHYMDEVVLFRVKSSLYSLANPKFFEEEILLSACILGAMDGGIEIVVSTLCKCDDMGILSLVVAKYVGRGRCWDLLTKSETIWPLCESIIRFIEEVHNKMEADMKMKGEAEEHLLSLVQFILEHLTKNAKMAHALGVLKIGNFIQCFVDKFCLRGSSVRQEKFLDILALCKLHEQNVQYINSWMFTNLLGWNVERGEWTCQRLLALKGPMMGLFGVAGMGKTTLSKAICKAYFAKFGGIVCHMEFNGDNHRELRKKVLGEFKLFDHTKQFKDYEVDTHLSNCLSNQKVFLCLDNVQTEEDIEEVNMYLTNCSLDGSKLLVTSQSFNVLTQSLGLKESDCIKMPELDEKDATDVFLHYARCTHKSFNKTELDAIKRHVEVCMFTRSELDGTTCGSREQKYLPLALKVWGTQMGAIGDDPLGWDKELQTLDKHKLNTSNDPKHPLFCVLRQAYDKLDQWDCQIFLDLALVFPKSSSVNFTDHNIVDWLCIIYECSEEDVEYSLEAMRRKGLLENSEKDIMGFKIHNLYLEFARVEARYIPFDKRRICQKKYKWDKFSNANKLLEESADAFWRRLQELGLQKNKAQFSMDEDLICVSNLKVLQLYDCKELEEFNVGSMKRLISLDVMGCQMLGENFRGIENLKALAWFRWEDNAELSPHSVLHLYGLSSLQVIFLEFHSTPINFPNVRKWAKLHQLAIRVKS